MSNPENGFVRFFCFAGFSGSSELAMVRSHPLRQITRERSEMGDFLRHVRENRRVILPVNRWWPYVYLPEPVRIKALSPQKTPTLIGLWSIQRDWPSCRKSRMVINGETVDGLVF